MSSKTKTNVVNNQPAPAQKNTAVVTNGKQTQAPPPSSSSKNNAPKVDHKHVVHDEELEEEENDETNYEEDEEKTSTVNDNNKNQKAPFDSVAKKRGIDDIKNDESTDDSLKKQKTQPDATPATSNPPIVNSSNESKKTDPVPHKDIQSISDGVKKIVVPKKNIKLSPQYFRNTFTQENINRTKLRLVAKTTKATIHELANGKGPIIIQSPMIKAFGYPQLHALGGLYVDDDDKAKSDTDRTFSSKFLPIYKGHPHNNDFDNQVLENDPEVGTECKDFCDMLNGHVLDRLAVLWLEHTMDYKDFIQCSPEQRQKLADDTKKSFNTWVTKADKERGRESDEAKELFGKISVKRKVFAGKDGKEVSVADKTTEDKKNKSKKVEDVEDVQNQSDEKSSLISDEVFAKNLERIDQGINAELTYEEVSRILKETMSKGFTYKPMQFIDDKGNPIDVINEETGAIEQDKIKKWMHQQVFSSDYVSIKFTIRITKLLSGTVYVSLHLYGPIQYIKNNSQYSNQTYEYNVKGLTSTQQTTPQEQHK